MLDAEGMAILNKAKRSLDSGNLDFGDHFGKNRRPPLSFQTNNAHREKGSSWRPLFVYLPFWVVCGGNFRLWEGKREEGKESEGEGGVSKGERRGMRHENATGICKEKRQRTERGKRKGTGRQKRVMHEGLSCELS